MTRSPGDEDPAKGQVQGQATGKISPHLVGAKRREKRAKEHDLE